MKLPKLGRKDVEQEVKVLLSLGFQFEGFNASGHLRFRHPEFGRLSPMSGTPRSPHWRQSHRGRVAALMGLTGGELNKLLGSGTSGRGGSRKKGWKKTAGGPRKALRIVEPAPEDTPAPAPRAIEWTQVRWRRQRCDDCGYPWSAECVAVQPCPHCESKNTREERAA